MNIFQSPNARNKYLVMAHYVFVSTYYTTHHISDRLASRYLYHDNLITNLGLLRLVLLAIA